VNAAPLTEDVIEVRGFDPVPVKERETGTLNPSGLATFELTAVVRL
jgi:hypothetical protein